MAEIVNEFPIRYRRGKSKYPLNQWADGRIWKLTKSEDFPDCKLESIATIFRTYCWDAGKKAKIRQFSEDVVFVQAIQREPT